MASGAKCSASNTPLVWEPTEVTLLYLASKVKEFKPIIAPSRSNNKMFWPKVKLLAVLFLNVLDFCFLLVS